MNVEGFSGFDAGEGITPEAFEKYKQQMAGATQDIRAWKKSEQKQKQKEDELLKILMQYLKRNQKTSFILLISRMLEQNVPAGFILGIILLGDYEIQQALDVKYLKAAENPKPENAPTEASASDSMLAIFGMKDKTLPLKAKVEFDYWFKNLFAQASVRPHKIILTAEEQKEDGSPSGRAKLIGVQLLSFILREFLEAHEIEAEFKEIHKFADLTLATILQQLHQQVDNQAQLGEAPSA